MFCTALKILLMLTITKTLGGMIRMVLIIVWDILPYIIFFIVCLISITVLYFPLFYRENEKFQSFKMTLSTTFAFGIGEIDFSLFEEKKNLGIYITMVWVVLCSVLILNILIAILNDRYADIFPRAHAQYIAMMYENWKYYRYIPGIGAFGVICSPFNVIIFAFLPFYYMRDSIRYKVDLLLYYFGHIVGGLLVFIPAYIGYNLILAGLVYLYAIRYIYKTVFKQGKLYKLGYFIM